MKAEDRVRIGPDFDRALALWHGGAGRAAVGISERLAAEYPDQPAILGMSGAISRGSGEHERAVDYYRRAAVLSPRSELVSLGLFHSLRRVGRRDEAMDEMGRFLAAATPEDYGLLVNSPGEVEG